MPSLSHRPSPQKPRFSFSETLLVLIAGAALLAGIYTLTNLLLRKNKADQTLSLLWDVVEKIDAEEDLGEELRTPWGGAVEVTREGKAARPFSVVMKDVPSLACKHIALQTNISEKGLKGLWIGETIFAPEQEDLTPRTVTFACTAQPEVQMIWDFNALEEPGE